MTPTETSYLVGLIGTGVRPSLTPAMHMTEGRALGLDYVYRPIDLTAAGVSPDRIGDVLSWARTLGFDAVNVTHPCKQIVMDHLDDVEEVAATLGAVNTVLFTDDGDIGYNTDTTGFAHGFTEGLPDADLADVVLVGAGGAGTAVADALLRLGAAHLTVVDLDVDRAGALAHDLATRHPLLRIDAAAFTRHQPACPNTPASRSTHHYSAGTCGWPTSSTAPSTPRCFKPHAQRAQRPSTEATWPSTRPSTHSR